MANRSAITRTATRWSSTPSAFRPSPMSTTTGRRIPTRSMWWSAGRSRPIARQWTFQCLSRIGAPLRRPGRRYSAGAASKTRRSCLSRATRTTAISSITGWYRCPKPPSRIFELGLLHLADRGLRHTGEIVCQQIVWARPQPFVQVDLFELAVVPCLHDLEVLVPRIPDRVSETRGDVDRVTWSDVEALATPARSEQRHLAIAAQVVIPFVRVGVPMQIALFPALDNHLAAGHVLGGRELVDAGEAERATLEVAHRLRVLQKPEFVRGLPWPRRVERLRDGQDRPRLDVGLSLGEHIEEVLRQIEVGRKHVFRRHIDPIGDRERAVLGERAIVEGQDEVAGLVADALD